MYGAGTDRWELRAGNRELPFSNKGAKEVQKYRADEIIVLCEPTAPRNVRKNSKYEGITGSKVSAGWGDTRSPVKGCKLVEREKKK
jgi:hypothetical protein